MERINDALELLGRKIKQGLTMASRENDHGERERLSGQCYDVLEDNFACRVFPDVPYPPGPQSASWMKSKLFE